MAKRNTIEAGGLVMVLAGFGTAAFMWATPGLGFMVLALMNVAVGFWAMGFTTMSKPHLWPVTGIGSIGLAVALYVGYFGQPLWASIGVLGGAICLVGGLAGQFSGSPESAEPS
jgi:hypothetical protein